jgi:predicted nuclease with TOPRIM domain
MENLTFDIEDVYNELKERAEAEGAYAREEWDDLVDEVLDGKREFNELDDDAEWQEIAENLKFRYDEFAEGVDAV